MTSFCVSTRSGPQEEVNQRRKGQLMALEAPERTCTFTPSDITPDSKTWHTLFRRPLYPCFPRARDPILLQAGTLLRTTIYAVRTSS